MNIISLSFYARTTVIEQNYQIMNLSDLFNLFNLVILKEKIKIDYVIIIYRIVSNFHIYLW